MEVRIAVADAPREVVLESGQTPEAVIAAVEGAIAAGSLLALTDDKGRQVLIPGNKIVFVEVGASAKGRVGFSA